MLVYHIYRDKIRAQYVIPASNYYFYANTQTVLLCMLTCINIHGKQAFINTNYFILLMHIYTSACMHVGLCNIAKNYILKQYQQN